MKKPATTKKYKTPRIRKLAPPGSAPGEISYAKPLIEPIVTLIKYNLKEYYRINVKTFEEIVAEYSDKYKYWINIDGLSDETLMSKIGKFFNLHALSLEDVINVHQRPKIESYDDFVFLVLRAISSPDTIQTEQLSIFLGHNFIITFQVTPGDCLDPVRKRLENGVLIRDNAVNYLAYTIIDAVIDVYFPLLERYADYLEKMEQDLIHQLEHVPLSKIHETKSELILLRRIIWSHRELTNSIVKNPPKQFDNNTLVYIRDCYDHTLQQLDLVETYRDMSSNLMELHYLNANFKANEVMKVLTVIASIFIPLTFITGIYGMNFKTEASPWNMPELGWYWGYPGALILMAAVAFGLIIFFKRKRWF